LAAEESREATAGTGDSPFLCQTSGMKKEGGAFPLSAFSKEYKHEEVHRFDHVLHTVRLRGRKSLYISADVVLNASRAIRTPDPQFRRLMLYPLSYGRD
jgi:hypothetical protein